MTIVRINVIEVPPGSGDELALRFARRAGAVDNAPGFEGFDLLRPTDGRLNWLVVTRWSDEASFRAWTASPAFAQGHRGASDPGPGDRPVASHSELWSFDLVDLSAQP
jgi:heme-degrading monooxygenase HmoA